jgi:hypothetical protein
MKFLEARLIPTGEKVRSMNRWLLDHWTDLILYLLFQKILMDKYQIPKTVNQKGDIDDEGESDFQSSDEIFCYC